MSCLKCLFAAYLISAVVVTSMASAGPVHIQGIGGSFIAPVKSLKEQRWDTVVRQQYDYSCGSAALATLLTFHYERPIAEDDIFRAMFEAGDKLKIQAQGFSMLDMKEFLDRQDLRSAGFGLTLDQWEEIGVPGIALINTKGYKHFIVVKGVKGDKVLLGDPALGLLVIPRNTFQAHWNGVALLAREGFRIGQLHFNSGRDWGSWSKAPLAAAVNRTGLGMLTLSLPGLNEMGR